jgi:Skp family chaperone for outer membrane proteins
MRLSTMSLAAGALALALTGSAFAQTPPTQPPTQPPPKPQTPPAQPPSTPPAAAQPAPKPAPPVPFPQDSKMAFVDLQQIASGSAAGKDATAKLQALTTKKQGELAEKNKQLTAAQQKLTQGGAVLNESARGQLEKEIERIQRDIQYSQSNAQAEVQDLQNDLMADFQKKVLPVIEEIAKEKGLYTVFTTDVPFAYVHPGLNLSSEVIKRLDAKK